jgi:hypothetical protein
VNFWVNFNLAKEKIEQKIKFILAEVQLIKTNTSDFDCGKDFSNPKHAFSNDLDFFAERGFFSYLNRTSSFF